MLYLLLRILIGPLLLLAAPLRRPANGKTLLIHTGKIGDYVNLTTLYPQLEHISVVIDRVNLPLAQRDDRLQDIIVINDVKRSVRARLGLLLRLYWAHYQQVIVTTPSALNLFLGAGCISRHSAALYSDYSGRSARRLLRFFTRSVRHEGLVVECYRQLPDIPVDTVPPYRLIAAIDEQRIDPAISAVSGFRVGLGIASGNPSKNLPLAEWTWLVGMLDRLGADLFVFGTAGDSERLSELQAHCGDTTLHSLLGRIALQDLPDNLSCMHLFISADSGPAYIADSVGVPLLTYAGPCAMDEQRPLGDNNLIVAPSTVVPDDEVSHVFRAPYDRDWHTLYMTNETQRMPIETFIQHCASNATNG